ncbi:hypothetical protein FHS55_000334 [Angulomicrobium tetraedrale]|uniref:DUF4089 domain-containing protein n=1 Tax=Ancylobacter tetraedralis TaxID=217068 RepID=A0A839Z6N3_9HYPH|nr:DUF4089 domain-containing protein [Ancylobacter tetraedralis]MBB3769748.1 hypothetical protein [Ancylobacter tetraedralis]
MSRQDDTGAGGGGADSGAGALLDAGLAIEGLPLEPELRPRVVMHLATAIAMARLVTSFALPDDAEPAPVYVP